MICQLPKATTSPRISTPLLFPMSLYHEAAKVLASSQAGDTSIKSLVYNKKGWKSDPKTLFALSTEAAKWSEVLSEVVERSGLLKAEKQVRDLTDH